MKQKLPFKFSYKVTDTFYAGEYPFSKLPKDGIEKLKSLTDFGVTTIIDLTKESLTQYAEHLPETCTRLHFPTIDYTSPEFSTLKEIHTIIDEAESRNEKIYVHCKGGYDRTGVVVATYFIYAGLTPEQAKKRFRQVSKPVKGRYPHPPLIETNWKALDDYKKYLEESKTEVPLNEAATRLLWTGMNDRKEVRKVYYIEYFDGLHLLILTDADDKFVAYIDARRICNRYMPWKYESVQPDQYAPAQDFGD